MYMHPDEEYKNAQDDDYDDEENEEIDYGAEEYA